MAKVLVLSGAGISAESGISTFRDSNGLWEEYDVKDVCTAGCLENNRDQTIEFYDKRRSELKTKEPNKAHRVLAELKSKYKDDISIITQNVDNLFEKAGLDYEDVIHIHGFLTQVKCEKCGFIYDIEYQKSCDAFNGKCPDCHSKIIRPNIVMFGEAAPNYRILNSELENCELLIVIGTSGNVLDVSSMAKHIKYSVLNNLEKSDVIDDSVFSQSIYDKATVAIDEIYKIVQEYLEPLEHSRNKTHSLFKKPEPAFRQMGIMIEGSFEHYTKKKKKVDEHNESVYQDLMKKHNVSTKDEAYTLEVKELSDNYKLPLQAKIYLDKLNQQFKDQEVKFYYWNDLFYHEDPEESDWRYVKCKEIKLIDNTPYIIGVDKNHSLLNDIHELQTVTPTIKEILQKAEVLANTTDDFQNIAQMIIDEFDDKIWAKKVYSKAYEKLEEYYEASGLATSISENIDDIDLLTKVAVKGRDLIDDTDEFSYFIDEVKDIKDIEDLIETFIDEYSKECKTTEHFIYLAKFSKQYENFAINSAYNVAKNSDECMELIYHMKK